MTGRRLSLHQEDYDVQGSEDQGLCRQDDPDVDHCLLYDVFQGTSCYWYTPLLSAIRFLRPGWWLYFPSTGPASRLHGVWFPTYFLWGISLQFCSALL